MILHRIIRCSLRLRFIRAHVLLCTAVLELITRHYMVSGEYCTFSAFSTMVSRLALDHLDHYLNKVRPQTSLWSAHKKAGGF